MLENEQEAGEAGGDEGKGESRAGGTTPHLLAILGTFDFAATKDEELVAFIAFDDDILTFGELNLLEATSDGLSELGKRVGSSGRKPSAKKAEQSPRPRMGQHKPACHRAQASQASALSRGSPRSQWHPAATYPLGSS